MQRIITVLLAFLFIGVQAFSQNAVSGKVVDASGEPLVGVNVLVKGTTTGTMTDLDGAYSLSGVKAEDILVFSCIGYASQEVKAASKTINVTLKDDAAFLDEVVVVGYGTARKKDVSGAIASLNYAENQDIANLPNPNAYSALSSRVAGFNYLPTTSASGDNSSTMTIRGKNVVPISGSVSASNASVNAPLVIVDGVISAGSINEINTSDIQSIDVLKDASAAAIYGNRAANGVIIITTKEGSSEKPTIRFNASVSLSDWNRMPKMQTDETAFFRNRFFSKQANDASLKGLDWRTYDKSGLMSEIETQAYNDGIYTDWLDEISRTGVGQKYDLSVSGKNKTASYYVSADYTRQQGIRIGDDYEKFNALAKVDFTISPWFKIGFKGNFSSGNSWGTTARIQNATWMSPYSYVKVQTKGYENWYNAKPDGSTISPLWGAGEGDSYLWTDHSSKSNSITGVGYAQIDFPFLKGLSYRFTLQGRKGNSTSDTFNNPEIWVDTNNTAEMDNPSKYGANVGGSSSASNSTYWNMDNILSYTKDIQKVHFDVMLGYTREKSVSESLGTSFKSFSSPTYLGVYSQNASAQENKGLSRGRSQTSAIGYLARLNFNYASKYYISGNFRRDGWSAFASDHKWGNFWGASAAWVISNENFIKDNADWLDFLKLRFSWGQNGSRSVGAYATLATVGATSNNNGDMTYTWLGEQSQYGVYTQNLPNHNLTWATVEKADLGIDFSFWGGRLNGSIDGYLGRTKDMLVYRSAPYVTGYTNTYDNVGLITNNGIEIALNSVNIAGNGKDKFRWESNLVFDHNTNCIQSLYGPDYKGNEANDVANALAYGFDSYYALQVGHALGSAYDLKLLGIFQSDEEAKAYVNKDGGMIQPGAVAGDLKFEDTNGDGKINDDDRQYLGTGDPLFTLNFGNTLSWKNFSLYFNFRWAAGDDTHFLGYDPNAFGTNMTGGNQLAAVSPWCNDANWKNTDTIYPRYGYSNSYNYLFWNSRGFLKLKDLSLAYNFDQKVVRPIGLNGLRIYVAATDVFTITNWSGLDPETGGTIAAGAGSTRYGSSGAYKTFTFGVNLTF